jgi:hypothetical protein
MNARLGGGQLKLAELLAGGISAVHPLSSSDHHAHRHLEYGLRANGVQVPQELRRRAMTTDKLMAGAYESAENILHLWFTRRIELVDEEAVRAFFDEVMVDWIQPCPTKPYLLVNFGNLHLRANMAKAYAKNIARFQPMVRGTYRYGLPPTFTGVAVALGNLQLAAPANIFPDERSAREAIRVAKERQESSHSRD